MKFKRLLNLPNLLKKKSFFLFGPRAVGKSFLIKEQFEKGQVQVYDLLDARVFADLQKRPSLLEEKLSAEVVIIDEIQKLPELLNQAQRLIENNNVRFLFTGSNASKLRRKGVNLLAGRAWEARLFPLVYQELKDSFDLNKFLLVGGFPSAYLSPDPFEELGAYTGVYLQEEVAAEGLAKNLGAFSNFLDIAATKVSEEINYQSISSDCGVSGTTVQSYFTLLEHTLLGFRLSPFRKTKVRKAVARPKFYYCDVGLTNSLLGVEQLSPATEHYGKIFEQFILLELRAYLSYRRVRSELTYWRSHSGFEVDAIVGNKLAIEVKSSELVTEKHLKGLRALAEEGLVENYIVVSRDPEVRKLGPVTVYPWQEFLNKLWAGELV